ncbi:hypothetical protein BC629DRAFT_1509716 [Irpex lacteus]|nr:hypothetical protein BC629DRAFT_1509716 [Irpex lacteus]
MRSSRRVAVSFWLAGCYTLALASQSESPFQWGFNDQSVVSTFSFSECQQLPLLIVPLNTTPTYYGIPPYYLFAFEPGGIPSVSMIGTDPKNLSWQNTHQRGASLMIMVQDSQKSTGGIDTRLYNVTAGSNTTCLSSITAAQLQAIPSITPNATGKIETCQPWGLTIAGGEQPYTVVLTALDSSSVTNTSVNSNDYTYVNEVAPSELFMGENGKWGVSSPLVVSDGPNRTDCSSASTPTTSSSSAPSQHEPTTLPQKHDHSNTPLIAGISAAGVVAVLLLSGAMQRGTWDTDRTHAPDPWPPSQPVIDPDMHEDAYKPRPLLASSFSSQPVYSPGILHREIEQAQTAPATTISEPASPAPSAPLTARERKILEARAPSSSSLPSTSLVDVTHNPDTPHEIFFQHRDGGDASIVHELPPPYADRTAPRPSSPPS